MSENKKFAELDHTELDKLNMYQHEISQTADEQMAVPTGRDRRILREQKKQRTADDKDILFFR